MSAGHFGQISLFLPLCTILELPYLHGARDLARREVANIVAYDQGLNTIEFRICSSGSSGVIQLLVRSMISPVAPHAAFCHICVFIPSMNSKQPVRQQAIPQGMGPKGISRVVNQGLARQYRQGFLPWTVDRDDQFCHFGSCGPNLDCHHAKWHGDL